MSLSAGLSEVKGSEGSREHTCDTHSRLTPPEIIVIGLGEYGIRLCEFLHVGKKRAWSRF